MRMCDRFDESLNFFDKIIKLYPYNFDAYSGKS